jgi:hypothetical protein
MKEGYKPPVIFIELIESLGNPGSYLTKEGARITNEERLELLASAKARAGFVFEEIRTLE